MGKKGLVGGLIFICLILGYVFYDHNQFREDDIVLEFHDIKELEYMSHVEPQDLIKSHSGDIIYQDMPDTSVVGKQSLQFIVKDKGLLRTYHYEIEIKDTKAPEIKLKKTEVTMALNSQWDITKWIASVKDGEETILYRKRADVQKTDKCYYTYDNQVNTKKVGQYQVSIYAVDKHGNDSEKRLVVNVKEEQTQPIKRNHQKVIVIDPGHQKVGNQGKEAIGPGSSVVKAKVTSGTTGVFSRIPESQVNLDIGMELKKELETRGYQVIMTRTTQNVNLSNQQRASIGNKNQADAIIHLHCDGGPAQVRGAHTIAPAQNNPYVSNLHKESSLLAQKVIKNYSVKTGIKNKGVSYRNDLTGLNWSRVPSIYLEMGFLSNREEDKLLTNRAFQKRCAQGVADGIDAYFQ